MCIKREKKQHMERWVKECNNNLIKYIYQIKTRFDITKWSQDRCTKTMYLKDKEKKRYKKSSLHPSKRNILPLTKISISYTNSSPKNLPNTFNINKKTKIGTYAWKMHEHMTCKSKNIMGSAQSNPTNTHHFNILSTHLKCINLKMHMWCKAWWFKII